ncbi:MAG: hypothetical protein NC251_00975 [Lachnoclostridium sp.]|nr:hypothetical protein [Lachnospira sp.]MCM1246988.1 hypothetical protein [Lachnoclostridium sp.]
MLKKVKKNLYDTIGRQKAKIEGMYRYGTGLLNNWNDNVALASVIILKVVMDFFFVTVISNIYGYNEFFEVHTNASKYILSWVICMLIWRLMPKGESIKALFMHLQFILLILPMFTLYAFTLSRSTKYILLVSVAIIIECLILTQKKTKYFPPKLKNLSTHTNVMVGFLIPLIAILIWTYGGFSGLEAFDLDKLYEIRALAEYPTVLSYINTWLTLTIIPFYIVYCLDKHQYILVGILLMIELCLYMILAHKMIYLAMLVVLVAYILAKSKHLVKLLYIGLTGLLLLLTAMFLFEKDISTITLIGISFVGYRFLFLSATNKFFFYDFFSQYPHIYFSDGTIGKLLGMTNLYKYTSGQMVYGFAEKGELGLSSSNTGYLGDGYAQLGALGIIICAIALAYIIDYISNYEGKIPFCILASMVTLYVIVLADVALTTVLLTSGLFIFIIFLAIYAEDNIERNKL